MSIDWFTFAAQILNFVVLVWLLKRFLYGPIVTAMEQRETRIAESMSEVSKAREAAEDTEREYQVKLNDLANTREELLVEAGREVEAWRDEHLRKAADDVEQNRQQWKQSLVREKQSLMQELQLNVACHATDLSRHLLQELANERLQSQLVEKLISVLENVDDRESLQSIGQDDSILIETSHELTENERTRIRESVARQFSFNGVFEFRVNVELVCGIELRSAGCKLAWSIQDSLTELKADLIHSLDEAIPAASFPEQSTESEAVGDEAVLP